MNNKLSPANIVILASGAVTLVFSFLHFYGDESGFIGKGFLFPISTLVALCGTAMAVVVVLKAFTSVSLPEKVLGFAWVQVHLILALFSLLIMIGYLIGNTPDKQVGFYFMLLGSIGLMAGAVLLMKEAAAVGHASSGTPGYGQPPGGYPPQGPPPGGYPPQQQPPGGYPPPQQPGYPPQTPGGYPPPQQPPGGYPPQQQPGGYPPPQQPPGGYPPPQQPPGGF
jgi:hypothetical protein